MEVRQNIGTPLMPSNLNATIKTQTAIQQNEGIGNSDKFVLTKSNERYHSNVLTALSIQNNAVLNNIYYRTVPKVRKSLLISNTLYSDIVSWIKKSRREDNKE